MKLGLVAVSTKTGLGYQTKAYYDHLKPDKTLLVDISHINGMEQHPEWYEDVIYSRGFPDENILKAFLFGLDVVLTAETPYNYQLYDLAKKMGVKTVEVSNYEFLMITQPNPPPMPYAILLPSIWHLEDLKIWGRKSGVKVDYLHLPVDRSVYKYRNRSRPKFIHIAGRPATYDRNGTWDFLRACPEGTVLTQSEQLASKIRTRYPKARVVVNIRDNTSLYEYGDVLVLPRRYGGNCLPLNEALSCGLPVIMTDVEPNNHLLPKEWLVQADLAGEFEPRMKVKLYSVRPSSLREKIEQFKSLDISKESDKANLIAEEISWQTMLPKYRAYLEAL